MAFTEFCCRSGGSNLNAGTRTGNSTEPGTSASFTYASGNWVASTGVFTVASGNPSTDGVAVGDFASVYADGSSVTGFVGRVTAVSSTTITVSLTAKAGTAPTDGTGNRTLKIGGAWQGPNGTSGFPFGFILNTLTDTTGERPRVNFKNDATYSITAAITHNLASGDYIQFQGYTTTYGDGGRAKIDGGTSGASYVLLTIGGAAQYVMITDFEFCNNGATGSADGTSLNAVLHRVVCHDVRGSGLVPGNSVVWTECEAYNCNQSNTANKGGFAYAGTMNAFVRCIAHDNTGSNTRGFYINGDVRMMLNCIADSNGSQGFEVAGNINNLFYGNDAYNNGGDGMRISSSGNVHIRVENSNFLKNGGYGLNMSAGNRYGHLRNNGFGSGTQANTSGTINYPTLWMGEVSGTVTYATDVTPWTDPANGDFRINLAAAKAAGRGSFLQTQTSYGGTVAYPDIGAAQSQASGSGGGSLINSQQLVRQGWIG